jgi:hypothetical protein
MPGVWVEQVTIQVVEVLKRAESLFAVPGDAYATETTGRAAEASRAIATRTAELSGAAAQAHAGLLDAAAQRLDTAAGADARLAGHLARAAETHASGLSRATDLRAGAAEVPTRLAPWADIPASELAAVKALRNRVAGMQQLLADHTAEAARAAGEIRALGYGQ